MVIGFINMNVVIRCRELPLPGQTVLANLSAEFHGVKAPTEPLRRRKPVVMFRWLATLDTMRMPLDSVLT